jgi:hypothetical protein
MISGPDGLICFPAPAGFEAPPWRDFDGSNQRPDDDEKEWNIRFTVTPAPASLVKHPIFE